ncbi:fibronectin type III domain-containing protein [Spirochaeta dissipatitropha]
MGMVVRRQVGLVIVSLILVTGCGNPFSLQIEDKLITAEGTELHEQSASGELARLKVHVDGGPPAASARTVLPEGYLASDLLYGVILIPDGDGDGILETDFTYDAIEVHDIPIGTYLFGVSAIDGQDREVYQSVFQEITLNPGANSIAVELFPLSSNEGGLEFNLNWPNQEADDLQVYWSQDMLNLFVPAPNVISDNTDMDIPNGTLQIAVPDDAIPSGTYYLTVELLNNGVVVGRIIEAVQIYDYQISTKTITIGSDQISQPPAAPANVNVLQLDGSSINISWENQSNVAEGFYIYRSDNPAEPYDQVGFSVEIYTDIDFTPGTEYTYSVSAYNSFGESDEISASPIIPIDDFAMLYPAGEPTHLEFDFIWEVPAGATGFEFRLAVAGEAPFIDDVLDDLSDTEYDYSVTALESDTSFDWELVAYNATSERSISGSFDSRDLFLYVSPTGSDDVNFGTTAGTPYLTLNAALSAAVDGDTIYAAAEAGGSLYEELLIIDRNVTISGSWNTGFVSQDLGNTATTIRNGAPGTTIVIEDAVVTLENLEIQQASAAGDGVQQAVRVGSGSEVMIDQSRLLIDSSEEEGTSVVYVSEFAAGFSLYGSEVILGENENTIGLVYGIIIDGTFGGQVTVGGPEAGEENLFSMSSNMADPSVYIYVTPGESGTGSIVVENNDFSSADISAAMTLDSILSEGSLDISLLGNVINGHRNEGSSTVYGIRILGDGDVLVQGNTIEMTDGGVSDYTAVYIAGTGTADVDANLIRLLSGADSDTTLATGVYVGRTALITNNIIAQEGAATNMADLYVIHAGAEAENVRIYHNTIVNRNQNIIGSLVYFETAQGSSFSGNVIYGNGDGNEFAVHYATGSGEPANHNNNIFFNSDSILYGGGLLQLEVLNTETWANGNISVNPVFDLTASFGDPEWYASTGDTPDALSTGTDRIAAVQTDLFGNARSAITSIGAVEFEANGPAVTNVYVDAASGNDLNRGSLSYPLSTVTQAMSQIQEGGVIRVTSGQYGVDSVQVAEGSPDFSIYGSYDNPDFSTRTLGPPGTVFTHSGASQFNWIISDPDVELSFDGILFQTPDNTAANRSALRVLRGTVSLSNSEVRTTGGTGTGESHGLIIQDIFTVPGIQNVSVNNTRFVADSGSNTTRLVNFTGSGAVLDISNSEFVLDGPEGNNTVWFLHIGGASNDDTAERNLSVSGSVFHVVDVGNIAYLHTVGGPAANTAHENTNFIFSDNEIILNAADAGALSYFRSIDLDFPLKSARIENNRFDSAATNGTGTIRLSVGEAPQISAPEIVGNRIRVAGAAIDPWWGINAAVRLTGEGSAGAIVANNIIELYGNASEGTSAVRVEIPDVQVLQNTLVFADTYNDSSGASNLLVLSSEAEESVVVNNIMISGGGQSTLNALNYGAPEPVIAANAFWNVADDLNSLNESPYAAGNMQINPMLIEDQIEDPAWYGIDSLNTPEIIITGGVPDFVAVVDTDINGNPRPNPSGEAYVSIGAHQYNDAALSLLGSDGPGGGYIYYLNPDYRISEPSTAADGWLYLEAAPEDADEGAWLVWDINPTPTAVGTEKGIGAGPANTAAIVNSLQMDGEAAFAADSYASQGFSDWFMPSFDEMDEMYTVLGVPGLGILSEETYWTSTEDNDWDADTDALNLNPAGNLGAATKDIQYRVRPVRRF